MADMGNTVKILMIILACSLALRIFIVEPAKITSESMSPTFHKGDIIFIDKTTPVFDGIHPGDLIVLNLPDSGLITKRVIATEGQTVEIYDSKVSVDGTEIREAYIREYNPEGLFYAPVKVSANHLYLLGDNRLQSVDSRHFGTVHKNSIVGIAKQIKVTLRSEKY